MKGDILEEFMKEFGEVHEIDKIGKLEGCFKDVKIQKKKDVKIHV